MKQGDIQIGSIYPIGKYAGRKGVRNSGMRGRVLEKGLAENFSQRRDHVRVVLVDPDGKSLVYADSELNRKHDRVGKPREKLVAAREILDPVVVAQRNAEAQAAEQERNRRFNLKYALQVDIAGMLIQAIPGLTVDDFKVNVLWDDEQDGAVVQNIEFWGEIPRRKANGVSALLRLLDKLT